MTRPYRSGHCTPGNVDEQHRRCTGAYAGAICACDCHVAYEQRRDEIDAFDWDQYAAMGESA